MLMMILVRAVNNFFSLLDSAPRFELNLVSRSRMSDIVITAVVDAAPAVVAPVVEAEKTTTMESAASETLEEALIRQGESTRSSLSP